MTPRSHVEQSTTESLRNSHSVVFSGNYTITRGRRQSKTLTIDERIPKSLETAFSIVICRQSGDKWQSKTLFLTNFDLRSSISFTFSIAAFPT